MWGKYGRALKEIDRLRARVVVLEREAGVTAGEVLGLRTAIEQAGLGQQLATQKAEVAELKAALQAVRDHQREALERAQEAAKVVALPGAYGYRGNGG